MTQRERITITIRQDLLRALDNSIDHQRIRNRSHAIEVALTKSLDTHAHQAVILASGEGVNMRPFTYEIPKPLIPVHDQPLLEHTIIMLRDHGIKDIVITVSHLAEKIEEYFGDGSKFNVRIKYVREKKPSGTGGALNAARKALQDKPFLLLYGDVLLDIDPSEFLQSHQDTKPAIGTLALTSVADPSAFGSVNLRGSKIVGFSEKPAERDNNISRLVFAGVAAFNTNVFSYIDKKKGELSLENDVFPKLIDQGRLYGYPFEGQWFDVSTPEAYEEVLKNWQNGQQN